MSVVDGGPIYEGPVVPFPGSWKVGSHRRWFPTGESFLPPDGWVCASGVRTEYGRPWLRRRSRPIPLPRRSSTLPDPALSDPVGYLEDPESKG